ncbi:hypothetical protein HNE_0345 [Hyphomonas neptunium ATCC 15444]|uniref:Uncharacterized protein n=2 Tax=Hyphomonas TaxID=85 RepID=Q0C5B8_HYPNA|nr:MULTISPECIES: DUF6111 family protein [Hyphomonas]ABI76619.1 hypothetical protein HNE_0345 [Hyphomonas neptunium ATCC 15444]KCZ95508.1 hypothetical protein HHI_05110 [Hyphomonas hirschiana VP5]
MAGRLLFEAFVFSLPFLVFGIYLLATRSAEDAGKRRWPIQMLFIIGLVLATLAWFLLILLEPRERNMCVEPARYENGQLIPARKYPCERHPEDVGIQRGLTNPSETPAQTPADDPT